jgi:hypothetical protein
LIVPSIRSQLITDAVFARLKTVVGLNVYRSEVDDQPPQISSDDPRVAPYVVLYPFPGNPGGDLADASVDLDYTCQVTCAAGYSADCEHLVDVVHPLLYTWTPAVAGVVLGYFKPPLGYDPGPVRIDRTIAPPRFSVPLQFRLIATAN